MKSGLQNSNKPAAFYASNSSEFVLAALESRPGGLAPAEIRQRLIQCGPNALPRSVRRPWYLQLASNFVHLFALLLWVGALLAWLAGLPQLSWAIVVVILINGVFSYWQEYQAERAAEALQALLPRQVMVRRETEEQLIPASELVPGDIVLLAEGAAIPADARVLVAERLRVDMSSLTGESKAIPRTAYEAKTALPVSTAGLPNLVFAGTSVVSGRGEAVVFATGANTEFGRIDLAFRFQHESHVTWGNRDRDLVAPHSDLRIAITNHVWTSAAGADALAVVVDFRSTSSSFLKNVGRCCDVVWQLRR